MKSISSSIKLGGAFIGLMAGVGFASGQEVLQFFISYGWPGLAGAVIASLLMSFLVMTLYMIGSRLKTDSHDEAINFICGPWLGKVMDWMITFFLFGSVVVMLAGAGSSAHQQAGVPQALGSAIAAVLTIIIVCLGIKRVITLLSLITPILAVMIVVIAIYSLSTMDKSFSELEKIIRTEPQATNNWFLSALLYVSYNVAATAAMLVVMGGTVKESAKAGIGGVIGGLGVGLLILVMSLALMAKADVINGVEIPTLHLSNQMSRWFGSVVLVLFQIKLLLTSIGLTFALAARLRSYGIPFFLGAALSVSTAYVASLLGFVKLVGIVYPAMGYMGSVLIVCIVFAWVRIWRHRED
jgi:uncharacterized membrane protein YkvI